MNNILLNNESYLKNRELGLRQELKELHKDEYEFSEGAINTLIEKIKNACIGREHNDIAVEIVIARAKVSEFERQAALCSKSVYNLDYGKFGPLQDDFLRDGNLKNFEDGIIRQCDVYTDGFNNAINHFRSNYKNIFDNLSKSYLEARKITFKKEIKNLHTYEMNSDAVNILVNMVGDVCKNNEDDKAYVEIVIARAKVSELVRQSVLCTLAKPNLRLNYNIFKPLQVNFLQGGNLEDFLEKLKDSSILKVNLFNEVNSFNTYISEFQQQKCYRDIFDRVSNSQGFLPVSSNPVSSAHSQELLPSYDEYKAQELPPPYEYNPESLSVAPNPVQHNNNSFLSNALNPTTVDSKQKEQGLHK